MAAAAIASYLYFYLELRPSFFLFLNFLKVTATVTDDDDDDDIDDGYRSCTSTSRNPREVPSQKFSMHNLESGPRHAPSPPLPSPGRAADVAK